MHYLRSLPRMWKTWVLSQGCHGAHPRLSSVVTNQSYRAIYSNVLRQNLTVPGQRSCSLAQVPPDLCWAQLPLTILPYCPRKDHGFLGFLPPKPVLMVVVTLFMVKAINRFASKVSMKRDYHRHCVSSTMGLTC